MANTVPTHMVLSWDTGTEVEVYFPGDPKRYYVNFETGAYWIETRDVGIASRETPSHFFRRSAGRWLYTHRDPAVGDWDELSHTDSGALETYFVEWEAGRGGVTASLPVLSWDVVPEPKQMQGGTATVYYFDFSRMCYWVVVPEGERTLGTGSGFIETSPEHPAWLRRNRTGDWYYTFSTPPTRSGWAKWGHEQQVAEIERLYQDWLAGT